MEMTIQRYLLNLISASRNMSEVLAYGYGGYEWLNNMRELLSKSEEMLPKMEAEICIKEMEELNREERYHNHMMNMLYGTEELESAFEERTNNKTNRLNRRKANKKHHKADRKHGKHKELTRKEENGVHGWRSGIIYGFRGNRIVPVGKTDRGYHKNRYSKKEKDFMVCMPETVPFYELNTDEDFRLNYAYRTWMEEQAEKEREEKYRFDDCGFLDYDYDFYDPYDIW